MKFYELDLNTRLSNQNVVVEFLTRKLDGVEYTDTETIIVDDHECEECGEWTGGYEKDVNEVSHPVSDIVDIDAKDVDFMIEEILKLVDKDREKKEEELRELDYISSHS